MYDYAIITCIVFFFFFFLLFFVVVFFLGGGGWVGGLYCLFDCVEVVRLSQPNGVMSSAVNLPNHTFTGQARSTKRLPSIVHVLSSETAFFESAKGRE